MFVKTCQNCDYLFSIFLRVNSPSSFSSKAVNPKSVSSLHFGDGKSLCWNTMSVVYWGITLSYSKDYEKNSRQASNNNMSPSWKWKRQNRRTTSTAATAITTTAATTPRMLSPSRLRRRRSAKERRLVNYFFKLRQLWTSQRFKCFARQEKSYLLIYLNR